MIVPELETERLILRAVTEDDAQAMYDYAKSPNVGPNAGWAPHKSVEESRKTINELFSQMYAVWGIVLKSNNKFIGSIGVHNSTKKDIQYDLELGYAISEDYWGIGITPEAGRKVLEYVFDNMPNVNTLICSHFSSNNRSKRVMEKLGFKFLKTVYESWENYDGTILDEECFLLTRDDYYKNKK